MGGAICQLAIHAVVQGSLWLWVEDPDAAIELGPYDLALVRGGPDHYIAHEPGAKCTDPEEFRASHAGDERSADPRASVFLCGAYQFSGDVGPGLLDALPQVLPLTAASEDSLHALIAVLSRELAAIAPGHRTVLDRLLDAVLVMSLRAAMQQSATAPGWYQALADPRLRPAVEAIHRDPARLWTVPELAAISGVSRATFARMFPRVLGQSPMQYLTDWRMTLARDTLRTDDRATLAQIAARIGYASPYAFAAAFQRHHGEPPGRWRQSQTAPRQSLPHGHNGHAGASVTLVW